MNEDIKLELDCLIEYDSRTKKTKKYILKERYDKIQNNWNELKKWLIQLQKFKGINQQGFSWGVAQEVLDKMQELQGDDKN